MYTPWSPWSPHFFILPTTLADNLTILQLNCRDKHKIEKQQLVQQIYDRPIHQASMYVKK